MPFRREVSQKVAGECGRMEHRVGPDERDLQYNCGIQKCSEFRRPQVWPKPFDRAISSGHCRPVGMLPAEKSGRVCCGLCFSSSPLSSFLSLPLPLSLFLSLSLSLKSHCQGSDAAKHKAVRVWWESVPELGLSVFDGDEVRLYDTRGVMQAVLCMSVCVVVGCSSSFSSFGFIQAGG